MNGARLVVMAFGVACLSGAGLARGADIVRGAEVYRQHCANCHGASGNSTWPGAPNLSRREGL
jgi:mono/diheme cytochrome c family protein